MGAFCVFICCVGRPARRSPRTLAARYHLSTTQDDYELNCPFCRARSLPCLPPIPPPLPTLPANDTTATTAPIFHKSSIIVSSWRREEPASALFSYVVIRRCQTHHTIQERENKAKPARNISPPHTNISSRLCTFKMQQKSTGK